MKLASLRHGRDGRLVVVDNTLQRYALATAILPHYKPPWMTGPIAKSNYDHCIRNLKPALLVATRL